MTFAADDVSTDKSTPTAECLLRRMKEVRAFLRRKGFGEHAIEHAITVLCRAAIPYINGTKKCRIEYRRAWIFKVAIRAAIRAAKRDIPVATMEPATLAALVQDEKPREAAWCIAFVLDQLTERQRVAVDLCLLKGMSRREAAKEMGIAVGTLCNHLDEAKDCLKVILAPYCPRRSA